MYTMLRHSCFACSMSTHSRNTESHLVLLPIESLRFHTLIWTRSFHKLSKISFPCPTINSRFCLSKVCILDTSFVLDNISLGLVCNKFDVVAKVLWDYRKNIAALFASRLTWVDYYALTKTRFRFSTAACRILCLSNTARGILFTSSFSTYFFICSHSHACASLLPAWLSGLEKQDWRNQGVQQLPLLSFSCWYSWVWPERFHFFF